MVRLEMRPRISSGAFICSIAMLLAVCAISAAPPTRPQASAAPSVGLAARPRIAAPMSTIQPAWMRAWRSACASALAARPPSVPPTPTPAPSTPIRTAALSARLHDLGVDAFLVTRLPNVRFLTGFTGSNGQLLLTADRSIFLTDGRYTEQSRHEVPDAERVSYAGEFAPAFLRVVAEAGVRRLAFEAAGVSYKTFSSLSVPDLDLVPTTDEGEGRRWRSEEH